MHDHVEVFIDESGDLGFSERSSRHLVVVALVTANPHECVRIVRRAHRRFSLGGGAATEFKFNRSGEQLRHFFFERLAGSSCRVAWGSVTKEGAMRRSLADKDSLWAFTVSRTASDMSRLTHAKSMHLVVDRRSPRPNVNRSLVHRVTDAISIHHAGYFPPSVEVSLVDSRKSEGLQLADFVAGAVFQSLERGNPSYLSSIQSLVTHGQVYF